MGSLENPPVPSADTLPYDADEEPAQQPSVASRSAAAAEAELVPRYRPIVSVGAMRNRKLQLASAGKCSSHMWTSDTPRGRRPTNTGPRAHRTRNFPGASDCGQCGAPN
eukprot:3299178-Prymnesium_polylepis.1